MTTQNAFQPGVRQTIVGTLTLKKVDVSKAADLPQSYLDRVLKNLTDMYEYGKTSPSKSVIDIVDGELVITFAYDQNKVDRFRGLDRNERAWDPDNKYWRVFVGTFDDVFDILGRGFKITDAAFEAITNFAKSKYYAHSGKSRLGKLIVRESWFSEKGLAIAEKDENAPAAVKAREQELIKAKDMIRDFDFKRKPFDHQLKGIEFLLTRPQAALLDEMGCGKSFQIATTIGILFKQKQIDRVLIVAPMSLVRTWQEELKLAVDEQFTAISGSPTQRIKALQSDARIFIIHYEGLRLEGKALKDWLSKGNSMLVFDESQRIKNLQAQTTQAAVAIRAAAKRCVIATGTPIANRPVDLFSQYLVMDNGKTFGTKFPAFKDAFCEMEVQNINVGRKRIRVERFIGTRNVDELQSRVARTSLRRLKSEVLDLPPVLYKDYMVELKSDQNTLYKQMRDTLKLEVTQMTSQDVQNEAANIMVKLLRLSQLCANPKLLLPEYQGPNAKLSELEELLEDILSDETKKVIVWSHFVDNVRWLVEKFAKDYGAVGHTGDMNVDDRQTSVSRFRDDDSCRLFIATPQSAKEGLTLLPSNPKMRADTMIYFDFNFDSASYIQSQARFHRIGQTAERCLVIHLMGDGTVDEYIRRRVAEKVQTAAQVLDEENAPHLARSERMGKDEILSVLS